MLKLTLVMPLELRILLAWFVTVLWSAAVAATLPTVVVLSTGGTIASKHNPEKGGYEPALTGEDLIAALPELKRLAQIRVEQVSNLSSSDMTPTIWLRLARRT